MDKKERFIKKANEIHTNKYDYSKVVYKDCKEKVCIICPIHGEFWQTPDNHLQGNNCPQCAKEEKAKKRACTTEGFIEKAHKIHGDKYDYSKVEYINSKTKITITCPKHGDFKQSPNSHLNGNGCPKCKLEKLTALNLLEQDKVIEKFKQVHGDRYDYSKVVYKGMHSKIEILCKKCGKIFTQEPNMHVRGIGCPYCKNKKLKTIDVIDMFRQVHGDKYDYSKVEYKTMKEKVCIICPTHGEFWQAPEKHIKRKQGCPLCHESHLERDIRQLLDENNIEYVPYCNKTYFQWLNRQHLDFYLPKYNVAIECQGIQHFKPSSFNKSMKKTEQENFKHLKNLDKNKKKILNEHGINILYYTDLNYHTFLGEKVINNKNEILEYLWRKT